MANQDNVQKIDEEELKVAEQEASELTDTTFTYKLRKPLTYEGKVYAELHFDFDSLTGADALDVEEEMAKVGLPVVIVAAFNSEYLIRIAARACAEPIGADAFRSASLFDYNKIRDRMRGFLLASEQ